MSHVVVAPQLLGFFAYVSDIRPAPPAVSYVSLFFLHDPSETHSAQPSSVEKNQLGPAPSEGIHSVFFQTRRNVARPILFLPTTLPHSLGMRNTVVSSFWARIAPPPKNSPPHCTCRHQR